MIVTTQEEAEKVLQARITLLAMAAHAASLRLAVCIDPIPNRDQRTGGLEFEFRHVMLSPGESAPPPPARFVRWTIFEMHAHGLVGRSA
jgi:hypothetical protein